MKTQLNRYLKEVIEDSEKGLKKVDELLAGAFYLMYKKNTPENLTSLIQHLESVRQCSLYFKKNKKSLDTLDRMICRGREYLDSVIKKSKEEK